MGRTFAGVFGSLAMAVVIGRGINGSGGVEGTLTLAIVGLVAFAIIGAVLGHIAQSTVDESVRQKIERELNSPHPLGGRNVPTAT